MSEAPISIDIVSDVVCPWCFIGKRRLEKAMRMADAPVSVRWHPYQLDPTIPEEGIDRKIYLERKFGDADAIARIQAPVVAAGEAEGIPFAMERITRSPNTLDAHRLIRWAETEGRQDA
ncbi:MAG: DsbA family oxidoreductase, partial [Parvibaculaceae bacterium]